MNNIINTIEQEGIRTDLPKLEIGDHVKVYFKIIEGNKERLQAYEGIVIAMKNGGIRETVTVRRVSYGIGVEKTFPINSPKVGSIEVIGHGANRRAKLYYLRTRTGKAAKLKESKK